MSRYAFEPQDMPPADVFVREVSDARICGGIHYRAAVKAGEAMGRRIGGLAAQRLHAPQ